MKANGDDNVISSVVGLSVTGGLCIYWTSQKVEDRFGWNFLGGQTQARTK